MNIGCVSAHAATETLDYCNRHQLPTMGHQVLLDETARRTRSATMKRSPPSWLPPRVS
jgi:hypothetical protein